MQSRIKVVKITEPLSVSRVQVTGMVLPPAMEQLRVVCICTGSTASTQQLGHNYTSGALTSAYFWHWDVWSVSKSYGIFTSHNKWRFTFIWKLLFQRTFVSTITMLLLSTILMPSNPHRVVAAECYKVWSLVIIEIYYSEQPPLTWPAVQWPELPCRNHH